MAAKSATQRVRARVTLWLVVYHQSVCLGVKPLETHDHQFFFQLNTCGHNPYITPSLMRGWFCHLQLLLALAITVILRSESCRTYDHILLSLIWDSPNLEGQVSVFISPRNRVPRYTPKHWVPFSLPPVTCKDMVEVFDPTSTQGSVQLRLALII
jgi:hypothetical protein